MKVAEEEKPKPKSPAGVGKIKKRKNEPSPVVPSPGSSGKGKSKSFKSGNLPAKSQPVLPIKPEFARSGAFKRKPKVRLYFV